MAKKKSAAKDGLTGVEMTTAEVESRTKNAKKLDVISIGDGDFMVRAQGKSGGYSVSKSDDSTKFECVCTDYYMHQHRKDWRCKHILATSMYVTERGPTSTDSRYTALEL